MGKAKTTKQGPDWEQLYQTSAAQEGYFSTSQAADAGYSPQLLAKHLKNGRMAKVRRGVYRLTHFPTGEHDELVVAWLWSGCSGVFSHETALSLHELSDVLPSSVHITLPVSWGKRRLLVPKGMALHFSAVGETARTWIGPVPVTSVSRTLADCVQAGVAPDLIREAFEQAAERGLIIRDALPEVRAHLARFFSVSRDGKGQ